MSDLLRSQAGLLILSILQSGPEHGYAIIEQIKARSGGSLALPEGTIYPVLHRLEGEGLLQSSWSRSAGRPRRVYELTGAGRESQRIRQEDWRQFAKAVQSVLGGAS